MARPRPTAPGIKAKLARASLMLLVLVAVAVLVGVGLVQLQLARHQQAALEAQIRKTLTTRGVSITRSHAFVFRTLVADNALTDMHNTIARTVQENDDVIYGAFLDADGRAWACCSPATPCRPSDASSTFPVRDTQQVLAQLQVSSDAGRQSKPSVREANLFGQAVLEFSEPVFVEGELVGVLRYGLTTKTLQEALAASRHAQSSTTERTLAMFAMGLLGVVVLGVYFARHTAERIAQPLSQLTEAARRLAGGDRTVAVDVASQDELQVLAEAFNRMVSDLDQSYRRLETKNRELESEIEERKRAQGERATLQNHLAQAQKMEAFGQLAGGVAHDFNNILAVVIGNSDLAGYIIEERLADEELITLNQDIRAAAERGAALTRQLLTFARREADNPVIVDVNETLRTFAELIRRVLEESVSLHLAPGDVKSKVCIDPGRLEQVLMNLCVNARDAMPKGGQLSLSTGEREVTENLTVATGTLAPGKYVWLRAEDSGAGIPADIVERIFEPFFTTKTAGQGTGLGLAVVHSIVQGVDGAIDVESEPAKGTTFTVFLPASSAPRAIARPRPRESTSRGDGSRVLLCEDEPAVRQMTKRILERGGYHVTEVGSPTLAIEELLKSRFDLLLTDVIMPQMNGKELADRVRELAPRLPLLFISGYTGGVLANQGLGDDSVHLLRKPFEPNELLERVGAVIARKTERSASTKS